MKIFMASGVFTVLLAWHMSWRSHVVYSNSVSRRDFDQAAPPKDMKSRDVSQEEISYIANMLQPRECLSLLYLLHHSSNGKREIGIQDGTINVRVESARTIACETMLLNYWRDPKSRKQMDCAKVTQTLCEVKREDLARWLLQRIVPCIGDTASTPSSLPRLQSNILHASTNDDSARDSDSDSMLWVYIVLAVFATTAVLMMVHYLCKKFSTPSQYIALTDKEIRSLQCCKCMEEVSLSSNKNQKSPVKTSEYNHPDN